MQSCSHAATLSCSHAVLQSRKQLWIHDGTRTRTILHASPWYAQRRRGACVYACKRAWWCAQGACVRIAQGGSPTARRSRHTTPCALHDAHMCICVVAAPEHKAPHATEARIRNTAQVSRIACRHACADVQMYRATPNADAYSHTCILTLMHLRYPA